MATGISGLHSRFTWGVRPHLELKQRTLLSSPVATGISWNPLSGLKGVKPPMKFLEGTRDCSLGPAGKEWPHLAMTGESCGFSRIVMGSLGFLSNYDRIVSGPLVLPLGSPVSIQVARGSTGLLSNHGRVIGPQFVLKGESRGLSRVAAGNFGFPRVVTVTAGSFSWCLWEVRNPFVL